MDDHVRGLLQHFLRFRGNFYAPRRVVRADDFAEVTPDFCGIVIDCADDFNGLFLPHQARNGCADGAHTILDGANFLFHIVLRSRFYAHTRRILASKETPTIMEFRRAFNEEPSMRLNSPRIASVELELLLSRGLRRIMVWQDASRLQREAKCQQKNYPILKLPHCFPRPKDGAWRMASCTGNLRAKTSSRRLAT